PELLGYACDLFAQSAEIRVVRVASRPQKYVAGVGEWQHVLSRELAKPTFQLVPLDGGMTELRNYDGDARMSEWRLETLDVQEAGSNTPTRVQQTLDVGACRYPSSAREPELRLRRRRTYWAAVPSDACVPSSDGGSILHDPIWYPCACGNHASECGACCGDGRWAYPCLLQIKRSIFAECDPRRTVNVSETET